LPDAKYAFASAYLKSAEARILNTEHVDRMSRISNIQDAGASVREVLDIIKDTESGQYLEAALVKSFDDVDSSLWRYLNGCFERLEWLQLLPDDMRQVLRAYIVKYDVVNIKAALQGITLSKKAKLIPVGIIYSQGMLDELAGAESVSDVIGILAACRLGDYADILREHAEPDRKSVFLIEARLDGRYHDNLLAASQKVTDGALLVRAFSIIIDMANLALISRAVIEERGAAAGDFIIGGGYLISEAVAREALSHKLADMPDFMGVAQYREIAEELVAGYGRTRSIMVVDDIIDKHGFRLLRDMLSPRVLTPLVLAWYLIVKEVEIRNLRLILKAIFDAVPLEEIREYLVSA